jgi:putative thioredoxin
MATGEAAAPGWIVDVGDADFEREVLERSDERPVVVDFWAPWCGPCRTLGPILERLAEEHAGAFVLARVNVDEAPGLAQAFQVRSIPSVKAIREGALAGAFDGAQPESVVRRFIEAILPGEADRLAAEGDERAAADDRAGAEAAWQAALAQDGRQPRALLGLGRLRGEAGDVEGALALLERIGPGTRSSEEADRLAAELRTRVGGEGAADEDELRRRIEAEPGDLAARLALGRLLASRGRHADALACLLEAVRRDPGYEDGAARRAMVDLFTALGPEHPLTQEYRSALARTLFR